MELNNNGWSSTYHHFGQVEFNKDVEVQFKYTGELQLNDKSFSRSCGCLEPSYKDGILTVKMNMNQREGEKVVTVTCVPTNTNFIVKATAKL